MRWIRPWHALVVLPAWLLWVSGLGYAAHRQCVHALFLADVDVTPAMRAACAGPSWRAPLRGLDRGWPPGDLEALWVASLVMAVLAAVVIVAVGRRTRRDGDGAADGRP